MFRKKEFKELDGEKRVEAKKAFQEFLNALVLDIEESPDQRDVAILLVRMIETAMEYVAEEDFSRASFVLFGIKVVAVACVDNPMFGSKAFALQVRAQGERMLSTVKVGAKS